MTVGTVTSIFLSPNSRMDRDTSLGRLVGSILSMGPEATVIALECEQVARNPNDPLEVPFCQPYAGITVTEGPSTFRAANSCLPEATICVEIDCKITGITEATCIQATTGPAVMFLPPDQMTSAVLNTVAPELTSISSSATTIVFKSPDMPYYDLTIGPLATPYVVENGTTVSSDGITATVFSTSTAQGTETRSTVTASATTGTDVPDVPVSSITGDRGAESHMLKLSGGLAGAAVAGMAFL